MLNRMREREIYIVGQLHINLIVVNLSFIADVDICAFHPRLMLSG